MFTAERMKSAVGALLRSQGLIPREEHSLPNGRRLDVAAVGKTGMILGVEIKVTENDWHRDLKWPDYKRHCQIFFIAMPYMLGWQSVPSGPGIILVNEHTAFYHRRCGWLRHAGVGDQFYGKPTPMNTSQTQALANHQSERHKMRKTYPHLVGKGL